MAAALGRNCISSFAAEYRGARSVTFQKTRARRGESGSCTLVRGIDPGEIAKWRKDNEASVARLIASPRRRCLGLPVECRDNSRFANLIKKRWNGGRLQCLSPPFFRDESKLRRSRPYAIIWFKWISNLISLYRGKCVRHEIKHHIDLQKERTYRNVPV